MDADALAAVLQPQQQLIQQLIDQQQQQIQLQQQAAAAAAAANVPAVPPPVDPRIAIAVAAMNPAQAAAFAMFTDLIDRNTAEGRKMWTKGNTGFTKKFDGSSTELRAFLAHLELHAIEYNWDQLLFSITTGPNEVRSLIHEHGQISIEQVQAQAANTYVGLNTRMAQAAQQLHRFLSDSMDNATLLKLLDRQHQYVINGVPDGPSMLKVLLSMATVNTRATVAVLRNELSKLAPKMEELGSNITEFNVYINSVLTDLRANGATVDDLVPKLFSAYQETGDKVFDEHTQRLEGEWEENNLNMTVEQLMNHADGKYRTLVQKGTWKAPTKEGEKLIALTVAYEALVATAAKKNELEKITKDTPKKGNRAKGKAGKEWDWKMIAPTGNQPKAKTFRGKDYVYCPHHARTKWVLAEGHKDGCSFAKDAGEDKKKPKVPTKEERKYARALMNVMDEDEEDDNDEEDVEDEDL